jgi:hypothetical protein
MPRFEKHSSQPGAEVLFTHSEHHSRSIFGTRLWFFINNVRNMG